MEGPRVAVAGAAGVVLEDRAALLGGFTDRLEATAAVQIRDPRHGWMPVGTALLEPRAEATATPLDDGTWLVVGGWSGHLPDDITPSGSAERCDPWNPQNRRPVPPPFADRVDRGLEGHAVCRLEDGRVLLVHEREGVVFDPIDDTWSEPFPLAGPRIGATLIPVPGPTEGTTEILAIGGGRTARDPAVETIRIGPGTTASSDAWTSEALPADLAGSAAIRIAGARSRPLVVVAGGMRGGNSVDRTWLLEPSSKAIDPGPRLPIEGGLVNGRLAGHGHRVILLGGERRAAGRPMPAANGAVLDPRASRAWPLPPNPMAGVRGTVLGSTEGRSVEIVGGYRFDATAPRGRRTLVLDRDTRLELPRLLVED